MNSSSRENTSLTGRPEARASADVLFASDDGRALQVVEAYVGKTLAGWLWWTRRARAGVSFAFIIDLFVLPEHRRRGVAKALLEHFEEEAFRQGLLAAELSVFAGNDAAEALYASSGYGETARQWRKALGPGG